MFLYLQCNPLKTMTMAMSKGYKGFDKDLKCWDFQYEVGREYEHDGDLGVCKRGFHFCENPFDVFNYYSPADSRFCEVESSGDEQRNDDDSKVATSKIKVVAEIGLKGLIEAGVRFILDKVDFTNKKEFNTGDCSAATNTGNWSAATNTGNWSAATNTGDWSAATNTGNRSAATNTGDCSAATNTGNRSAATVSGNDSIAVVTGYKSKAKGVKGCWLVLTERDANYKILCVKAAEVDGAIIKENTFYELMNGEFVEVD